ncbi:MAG TPA: TetR/AcrR family transcriptional regulator [Trebonia sp.]|nr:TetR/AcrR family transcriptional regulator [Trebonia sp.]
MAEGATVPPPARRPGGRTARVRAQILAATVELVARHGVAGVRYDEVAELAGVHRRSVYRNFPARDDLVREALLQFAEDALPIGDTGVLRRDVADFLMAAADVLATPTGRAIERALESARERPDLLEAVTAVLDQRMAIVEQRLARAIERDELPAADAEFLTGLLLGPVRLHVSRARRPFTRADAEQITDVVLAGVRATAEDLTAGPSQGMAVTSLPGSA